MSPSLSDTYLLASSLCPDVPVNMRHATVKPLFRPGERRPNWRRRERRRESGRRLGRGLGRPRGGWWRPVLLVDGASWRAKRGRERGPPTGRHGDAREACQVKGDDALSLVQARGVVRGAQQLQSLPFSVLHPQRQHGSLTWARLGQGGTLHMPTGSCPGCLYYLCRLSGPPHHLSILHRSNAHKSNHSYQRQPVVGR